MSTFVYHYTLLYFIVAVQRNLSKVKPLRQLTAQKVRGLYK